MYPNNKITESEIHAARVTFATFVYYDSLDFRKEMLGYLHKTSLASPRVDEATQLFTRAHPTRFSLPVGQHCNSCVRCTSFK